MDHKLCGYNHKNEYIEGEKNVCADIMLWLPHRPPDSNDDNKLSGSDITNNTFEVSMINDSNNNPKIFAQYDHQVTNNQCTKEELNLHGNDLVTEKTKGKELLKIKEKLKSGKASQGIDSKYIFIGQCALLFIKG